MASAIPVCGEPVSPDDLRGAREPHSVFGVGRDLGSREVFRPVLGRRTQWLQQSRADQDWNVVSTAVQQMCDLVGPEAGWWTPHEGQQTALFFVHTWNVMFAIAARGVCEDARNGSKPFNELSRIPA